MIDEVNLFRFADTEFSGVYRVETDKGQDLPFAVNVPTAAADQHGSESDLTRVDDARLKEYYPGWKFQIVRNPLEASVAGGPENAAPVAVKEPIGPLFANIALLLVLGLLFVEIVLAWAFGHYTVTEGALAAPAPGLRTTVLAAVIAVVAGLLFAAGATAIIMERLTGDFLGFLPDIARTWFETSLGIAQPLPGEGKNWTYETLPWLFGLARRRAMVVDRHHDRGDPGHLLHVQGRGAARVARLQDVARRVAALFDPHGVVVPSAARPDSVCPPRLCRHGALDRRHAQYGSAGHVPGREGDRTRQEAERGDPHAVTGGVAEPHQQPRSGNRRQERGSRQGRRSESRSRRPAPAFAILAQAARRSEHQPLAAESAAAGASDPRPAGAALAQDAAGEASDQGPRLPSRCQWPGDEAARRQGGRCRRDLR